MRQILKILITFLFIPVITPLYNILDRLIFVEVFGCGCVPVAQSNMFNIPFNANDLRLLVYSLLTVSMVVLAIIISKSFIKKYLRIIYIFITLSSNIYLSFLIYQANTWC